MSSFILIKSLKTVITITVAGTYLCCPRVASSGVIRGMPFPEPQRGAHFWDCSQLVKKTLRQVHRTRQSGWARTRGLLRPQPARGGFCDGRGERQSVGNAPL